MFLNKKKKILEILDTIKEAVYILDKTINTRERLVNDCIDAIEFILELLRSEKTKPLEIIKLSNRIIDILQDINNKNSINIVENIEFLQSKIEIEIKTELNIVFMPYKKSMWDSLETIYESAIKDENCVVKVVPIPYYEKSEKKEHTKYMYEGEEFSKDIVVEDYNTFDLAKEEPDIIFVHNVYDDNNNITQIDESFFTKNLKYYTDMLIYVPYYIPLAKMGQNVLYTLPGIKNVDKVILAGKFAEQTAIDMGIPKHKILTLGTPKLDSIYKKLIALDKTSQWDDEIKDNKVALLNTGCLFFVNDTIDRYLLMECIFNIGRYIKGITVIWRPHPLTEASIKRYTPELYERYKLMCESIKNKSIYYPNIILDETDDYTTALNKSDILISGYGSLINSFMITEKPIVLLDSQNPKESLIPDESFYYFYDSKEPWYEFLVKFVQDDYDPIKKNRKGLINKFYENTDGTCGEKVFKVIKNLVLDKQK